jgi:hypothetical protein
MSDSFNYLDSREISRREYLIGSDFQYRDSVFGIITARKGFSTNYASIDVLHNIWLFIFYALLASYGDKGATIHDWIYSGYGIIKADGTTYYPTRKECDDILYRALRAEGLARWRAYIFYAGVRLGGSGAYTAGPALFTPTPVEPNYLLAA